MSMLGIIEYAEHVGVHERTVQRWLAAKQLPDAVLYQGAWQIPSWAERTIDAETACAAYAAHIRGVQPVELVRWEPGSSDYDLVHGVLLRRTATTWYLATDDGPLELSRSVWLLVDEGDGELEFEEAA